MHSLAFVLMAAAAIAAPGALDQRQAYAPCTTPLTTPLYYATTADGLASFG